MSDSTNGAGTTPSTPAKVASFALVPFLITFFLMFLTWIVLSGKFTGLLLGLGVISSFLIAFFFHDLLFTSLPSDTFGIFFRFCLYVPWLIWEIVKANFHILSLVLQPRLKERIDPHIVTFKTGLKSDLAIVTLANSITLTPGTITVTAESDGTFRVHAIDKASADALPGEMETKVAAIFGETL